MAIDVIILPEGGTQYISPWRENEGWHKNVGYDFQFEEWQKNVLSLASRALSGNCLQTAVFLCLLGDHLVDRYDYHVIQELLKLARDYSWGANIYLAKDYHIKISSGQILAQAALSSWFVTAFEAGATDIVEVPIDRSGFNPIDANPLRIGSDLSRQRHELLQLMVSCILPETATGLFTFLDPFVEYSLDPTYSRNLLIIIDKLNPIDQLAFARKVLRRYPEATCAIVLYGYNMKASPKLREFCYTQNLRLIHCRGPFELRYFLLRLNKTAMKRTVRAMGKVEVVTLNENPIFDPVDIFDAVESSESPSLLITSSFHPHTDFEHCIEASRDAGRITFNIPPNTRYQVHPALDGHFIPLLLRDRSALTAWVYLGHGDGTKGLQVASSGAFEAPELWLSRFSSYGKRLPLAFFSACQSAPTARRFAEAGVGIAIGFEEDVPPEACRLLAAEVIRAALRTGGNRQEILNAFYVGCTDLLATGYIRTGPIAFYSQP
jgi:hypothetical protein